MLRLPAAAALVLVLSAVAPAQVVYPAPPERYDAQIRYRIQAGRDERVRQFRELTAFLREQGFVADPREDADLDQFDPAAERMDGTVPAVNAAKLLNDPRVRTVLLRPAGLELPADATRLVPVRLLLTSGLVQREQRLLHEQTVRQLNRLGFVERVGYNNYGYAVVRGAIPAGQVPNLLRDLRDLPAGWFAADTPRDRLELPLRSILPVRLIEVLPAAAPAAPPPAAGSPLGKLTPDLRTALADPAVQGKPIRVELVLDDALPVGGGRTLHARLRTLAAGASLEGVAGTVATARLLSSADVGRVIQLPEVLAARLPRPAVVPASPAAADTTADTLASTHVTDLHAAGYRGAGTKVVVIGSDFAGAAGLVGNRLPKGTTVLDLTAELTPTLEPLAPAAGPFGAGTAAALAAHAAAPEAELTLVRVEPSALHQLLTVGRAVLGDQGYSEGMLSRFEELTDEAEALRIRRARVSEEYRQANIDPSDEEPAVERRRRARAEFERLAADERAYNARVNRFLALKEATDRLAGAQVIVNTLVWESGYPHDGQNALSQMLDERFAPTPTYRVRKVSAQPAPLRPVWVQAANDSGGSVWAGAYRDADGNGVMEFAPPEIQLPTGLWTRELNFLTLTPQGGQSAVELPAGAKLRFAVQWREPHNPDEPLQADPVFDIRLRLLRQIDPAGRTVASDEFEEAGYSSSAPVRLLRTPGSGVYEQTFEVTLPAAGRYALRVEGRAVYVAGIPGVRQDVEIHPRLVVRPADEATAARGRVGFGTFTPADPGVGIPGDAATALTVGSAGSLTGAGPGVQLRAKPDVVVTAAVAGGGRTVGGSAVSAGLAGGVAASLASVGFAPTNLLQTLGLNPGAALNIPVDWVRSLPPRPQPATFNPAVFGN